jgi:hypothetical protein
MKKQCILGALLIFAIFVSLGCVEEKEEPKTTEPPTTTEAPKTTTPSTTTAPPTTTPVPTTAAPTTLPPLIPPSKPSSGKGNIIGKVYWNDNPVKGAEVKVCEKFSTFGGCSGKEYDAKTDDEGVFFINNVDPGEYVVLAKYPGEELWTYRTKGFGAAKDEIVTGETCYVYKLDTIRSNLILKSPKNNANIETSTPTLEWQSYKEAEYYEVTLMYRLLSTTLTLGSDRETYVPNFDTGEKLPAPLQPGEYTWWVEAYNKNGTKLTQCRDHYYFVVAGQPPIVKIISPKGDVKVSFPLTLKWEEWPEASYYKLYVARSTPSYEAIVNYVKVFETSYEIDELEKGRYCWKIDVYDINNKKIATSGIDLFYFVVE